MNHPLTDEMCKQIKCYIHQSNEDCVLINECMRGAYNMGESKGRADMLEQVIEWLKDELDYDPNLLLDLKEAMRPQED